MIYLNQFCITETLNIFENFQKEWQELEIIYATEKQKQENVDLEILKLEAKLDKLKKDVEENKVFFLHLFYIFIYFFKFFF